MHKKVIGVVLILGLVTILVTNIIEDNQVNNSTVKENYVDVTGDTSVEGTSIVPPNTNSGLSVGEEAPNFSLKTIDGEKISLADYRGKKVFLNFWATWCGPCRVEMPEMHEFQQKYGDEVEIIAVNATSTGSESIEKVRDFLNRGDFSFTVLLDIEGDVTDSYKIIGIPTTYFIGTDGTIQSKKIVGPMTYEIMEEKLEELS